MIEVMLDGEKFVIKDGRFVKGPAARAKEIKEAVKAALAESLDYIPYMDWYIGDFMEKQYGGKITKWERPPAPEGKEGVDFVY